MSDTVREGGCACGRARYRVVGDPIFVNNCYCTLCQRRTGSTSVVNAFFESDRVTQLSGNLEEAAVPTGSGLQQIICSCDQCHTALWSYAPRFGRFCQAVRVGTMDRPGDIWPDVAIYVADRMPWVTLPEGIPHFDEYYRPSEVLPPERMERLKAVLTRAAAAS